MSDLIDYCKEGNVSAVEQFLKDNPEIFELDEDEWTYLFNHDEEGRTAFYFACWGGHTEVVQLFLDSVSNSKSTTLNPTMLITRTNYGNWNALHCAFWYGYTEIAKLLLDQLSPREIVKVFNKYPKHGKTPLHIACKSKRTEVVQLVLNNPIYLKLVKEQTAVGWSLLYHASIDGNTEIMKLILDYILRLEIPKLKLGLIIGEEDHTDRTILHHACFKGFTEIVKLLLDLLPDFILKKMMDKQNDCDRNPFHSACIFNRIEVVHLLLDYSRDSEELKKMISEKDDCGWTAFHYACKNGCIKTVQLLLTHQQSSMLFCEQDDKEKIALDYAYDNGCFEIIQLLERHIDNMKI